MAAPRPQRDGLCVTGLFLLTYKVFEHNLDNPLSIVAGIAAVGVAMFSSDRSGNGEGGHTR